MAKWIVRGYVSMEVEAETAEEACNIAEDYFYADTHPDYFIEYEYLEE